MNKYKTKLTKKDIQENLYHANQILFENEYVVNFLKRKFHVETLCCLYMQPEQEYLYEILVNGDTIINIEFDTQTKEVFCVSEVNFTEYLNNINNRQEKKFLLLVREIAHELK